MREIRLYECIRCGYKTHDKRLMRRHFYDRKKPCPGQINNIEMTDAIKECILDNKVYIIEKKPNPAQVINQTINNYQQINNIVNNMDSVEKINKITEYKNIELLDFEDNVEHKYRNLIKKLEKGKIEDFKLNFDNIMEIIDNVTTNSNGDLKYLNVLHEQYSDKIKILNDGEWCSHIFNIGVKEIINTIKIYFFDSYECYLCRQLYDDTISPIEKSKKRQYLSEYYKLLFCFDLYPYVKGKTNNKILYQPTDSEYHKNSSDFADYVIEEETMKIFTNIKENIKVSEVNRLKRDIHTLIKKNTKSNIIELNKCMMDIIQMDDAFKNQIINTICANGSTSDSIHENI